MSINLTKHRESIVAAWKEVLDDRSPINWALFGYDGMSNDLKFVSKGEDGIEELIDDLSSGKIMYGFLKVDMPGGSIAKYVLINWQGEGAPHVRKGTCANHVRGVAALLAGAALTLHARTEEDLELDLLQNKLSKTAAPAFDFTAPRSEEPPRAPIGTTYQKVNPGKEINSKERDQFWMKEEQEEKSRVAAERLRKQQEKKKSDEEVKKRDAREAEKRDQGKIIPKVPVDPVGGNGNSAGEARRLIGHSTSAARARFEQNLAQGQMNIKTYNTPEKPVRSSVVAQRINSLTQQTDNSLQQEVEKPMKNSPIKTIDKIKMSLESPSQIQHEPLLDPGTLDDLSPVEPENGSFPSDLDEPTYNQEEPQYRQVQLQSEPIIKQNILDNDMFDTSHSSSSNDNDDDDSDNKFSTIKRSPHTKEQVTRQDTVIENLQYKNGTTTLDDISPESPEDDIYQDLEDDPGLTARALYDYQAADESEITFDPGDIITHIDQIDEGWWQGLGPRGVFGLFPANYVELLPAKHSL